MTEEIRSLNNDDDLHNNFTLEELDNCTTHSSTTSSSNVMSKQFGSYLWGPMFNASYRHDEKDDIIRHTILTSLPSAIDKVIIHIPSSSSSSSHNNNNHDNDDDDDCFIKKDTTSSMINDDMNYYNYKYSNEINQIYNHNNNNVISPILSEITTNDQQQSSSVMFWGNALHNEDNDIVIDDIDEYISSKALQFEKNQINLIRKQFYTKDDDGTNNNDDDYDSNDTINDWFERLVLHQSMNRENHLHEDIHRLDKINNRLHKIEADNIIYQSERGLSVNYNPENRIKLYKSRLNQMKTELKLTSSCNSGNSGSSSSSSSSSSSDMNSKDNHPSPHHYHHDNDSNDGNDCKGHDDTNHIYNQDGDAFNYGIESNNNEMSTFYHPTSTKNRHTYVQSKQGSTLQLVAESEHEESSLDVTVEEQLHRETTEQQQLLSDNEKWRDNIRGNNDDVNDDDDSRGNRRNAGEDDMNNMIPSYHYCHDSMTIMNRNTKDSCGRKPFKIILHHDAFDRDDHVTEDDIQTTAKLIQVDSETNDIYDSQHRHDALDTDHEHMSNVYAFIKNTDLNRTNKQILRAIQLESFEDVDDYTNDNSYGGFEQHPENNNNNNNTISTDDNSTLLSLSSTIEADNQYLQSTIDRSDSISTIKRLYRESCRQIKESIPMLEIDFTVDSSKILEYNYRNKIRIQLQLAKKVVKEASRVDHQAALEYKRFYDNCNHRRSLLALKISNEINRTVDMEHNYRNKYKQAEHVFKSSSDYTSGFKSATGKHITSSKFMDAIRFSAEIAIIEQGNLVKQLQSDESQLLLEIR
jgi:hypothetical protein